MNRIAKYFRFVLPGLLLIMAALLAPRLEVFHASEGQRFSLAEFQRLSSQLSEEPGFFATDNLISNETSYLHVLPQVEEIARPDQAYLGVGPDQNFTYISHTRPSIAFIIDIRRDNRLLHLYFKEIFKRSHNRWEYLSLLFGKPVPKDFTLESDAGAAELVHRFQQWPSDFRFFEENFDRLWTSISTDFPLLVSEQQRPVLHRFASDFFRENLRLRYRSHGASARPYFPTYEELLTERDLHGKPGNFLNSEEDFAFVKDLQGRNRIIPVVGNFAGNKALKAVGNYLKKQGYTVSVFYLSNVEFYLFRNDVYGRFIDNIRELPIDENSIFIRSYFNSYFGFWRPHPAAVPGFYVTSLVERIQRFLDLNRLDPYHDYWDLVTRDYLSNTGEGALGPRY